MTIIVDSGSTKADWCVVENGVVVANFSTQGITPVHQTEQQIKDILLGDLLSSCSFKSLFSSDNKTVDCHFYCSGCLPEKAEWFKSVLDGLFASFGISVHVYNDLLGAARALCGRSPGIACILGTGANSCLYDGQNIIANTPPLGYILGDEGSGANLGKRFLNGIFKGWLDKELLHGYLEWSGLDYAAVISRVYREPMPNRYLASIVPYMKSRVGDCMQLDRMIIDAFRDFLLLNLSPYSRTDIPVHFTGGVANAFEEQLRKAAALEHYNVGSVVAKPIGNLIIYHTELNVK